MSKKAYGFTIVELLIVIVVIGILAVITVVAYNGVQNRAHDAAVASQLSAFAKKAELIKANNGGYYYSDYGCGTGDRGVFVQYIRDNLEVGGKLSFTPNNYGYKPSSDSSAAKPDAYTGWWPLSNSGCSTTHYYTDWCIAAESKSGKGYYIGSNSGGVAVQGPSIMNNPTALSNVHTICKDLGVITTLTPPGTRGSVRGGVSYSLGG